MAWRRSGDKPLSEPMMVRLLTHICITRPQWVNQFAFIVATLIDELVSLGSLGTNFSEIWIKSFQLSIKNLHLKMPSAKWGSFGSDFKVININCQIRKEIDMTLKLRSHTRWAVAERRRADFDIPAPLPQVCSHIRGADAGRSAISWGQRWFGARSFEADAENWVLEPFVAEWILLCSAYVWTHVMICAEANFPPACVNVPLELEIPHITSAFCLINAAWYWQEHNDLIKWKHFLCHWPFVRAMHQSPVDSPHKNRWRRALMFSLIRAWTNSWANNRHTSDLRCHHVHYDITVMIQLIQTRGYWVFVGFVLQELAHTHFFPRKLKFHGNFILFLLNF